MWVHISQTLKKRSYNFQQGVKDARTIKLLKQLIHHYYPLLYPYITHQYIHSNVVFVKVQEPIIISEFNTHKQILKTALKRNNVVVKDIKFIA